MPRLPSPVRRRSWLALASRSARAAAAAAADEDWFAARFHLRRLVELSPDDEALKQHLQKAEDEWSEVRPPAIAPTPATAEQR